MPFLSPNQQCQSTEGKISHSIDLLIQAHLGVFQLCLGPLIAPGYIGEFSHMSNNIRVTQQVKISSLHGATHLTHRTAHNLINLSQTHTPLVMNISSKFFSNFSSYPEQTNNKQMNATERHASLLEAKVKFTTSSGPSASKFSIPCAKYMQWSLAAGYKVKRIADDTANLFVAQKQTWKMNPV